MHIEDVKVFDAIVVELNHFRFSRASISYQYLIEAVYIVIKTPTSIRNFNKNIYEPIAKKYGTRPENVQWALSKLIDLMYSNTSSDIIYEYFKFFDDEKPTLKFFIISVARKVYDNQEIFC